MWVRFPPGAPAARKKASRAGWPEKELRLASGFQLGARCVLLKLRDRPARSSPLFFDATAFPTGPAASSYRRRGDDPVTCRNAPLQVVTAVTAPLPFTSWHCHSLRLGCIEPTADHCGNPSETTGEACMASADYRIESNQPI